MPNAPTSRPLEDPLKRRLWVGLTVASVVLGASVLFIVGGEADSVGDAGPEPAPDVVEEPVSSSIEGYVVDRGTGVALSQASVSVTCDDGSSPTTLQVDDTGGFVALDLPLSGSCTVAASAPGYVSVDGDDGRSVQQVQLRDGLDVHGVELSLYEAATISGTVSLGGKGLSDCAFTVLYLEAPGRTEPYAVDVESVSGESGQYQVGGLGPGRVQVLAEHLDHAMAESAPFFLKPGEHKKGLMINLAAGGTLKGRVQQASGRPLPDALVALYPSPRDDGTRALRRLKAESDGSFRMAGVNAGVFWVEASAMGYRRTSERVEVTAGESTEVALTLTRRDGMGGIIRDTAGRPVPNASVFSTDPEANGAAAARSDAKGRFWIGWKPTVGTELFARHPNFAASARVRVDEAHSDVELVLKPGGRLRLRVADSRGRAIAVYTAAIWPEPGTAARGQSRRVGDSSGVLEVDALAPGTYTVRINAAGYPPAVTPPLVIAAQQLTDAGDIILEEGGAVTGRVIDSVTGEPLRGARVYLSAARAAGYRRRAPTASTGADGEFVIRGLPPGRLSLRFVRPGYLTRIESAVELTTATPLDIGDLAMRPVTGDTAGRGRMQYQGVGAVLRRRADGLEIQRVFDGSPASEAGLVAGTTIRAINGTPVQQLDLRRAVELIRGESGSEVALEVVLPGASSPESIRVLRGEVITPKHPRRR